ncbi:hypothetical protein [Leptolyngbya iicbica]|uniref:Uncharacterized protein n=1 Tax=Lyngbya confervoides BDU141951 TaxID=1574623 RepID=A0A8T6QMN6_9CYAN|nr:hypothetical protein [Leptolyngbya sp. LK]
MSSASIITINGLTEGGDRRCGVKIEPGCRYGNDIWYQKQPASVPGRIVM